METVTKMANKPRTYACTDGQTDRRTDVTMISQFPLLVQSPNPKTSPRLAIAMLVLACVSRWCWPAISLRVDELNGAITVMTDAHICPIPLRVCQLVWKQLSCKKSSELAVIRGIGSGLANYIGILHILMLLIHPTSVTAFVFCNYKWKKSLYLLFCHYSCL